jgi:hypothetical protein
VKTLDKQAEKFVSDIRRNPEERIIFADGKEGRTLSQKQLDQIKAVNRTVLGCAAFDAGLRAMYIAENATFDGTTIPSIMRMYTPFSSVASNQLYPNYKRWLMKLDYPWQDYNGMRESSLKAKVLDAYRRRSWFHPPYHYKHFILTTEEIATLYHPIGSVAKTPTLQRISSTRSEAPANLPI